MILPSKLIGVSITERSILVRETTYINLNKYGLRVQRTNIFIRRATEQVQPRLNEIIIQGASLFISRNNFGLLDTPE